MLLTPNPSSLGEIPEMAPGAPVDNDILSFDDHRRQREDNASLVRCVRCGKMILASATRCPQCGVNFQGEAQDFLHPDEQPAAGWPGWLVVIGAILLAGAVLGILAFQ